MDSMGIALRKSFVGSVDATPITVNTVRNPEMINRFLLKVAGYRFIQPVRGTPPYWQKVQFKLLAAIKQWKEDKYAVRPQALENWNLALFALYYTQKSTNTQHQDESIQPDLQLGDSVNNESIPFDVNIQKAPEEIGITTSQGESFTMKKRRKQFIIRYHKFSIDRQPESYFYTELFLFLPLRKENDLKDNFESFQESFEAHKQSIFTAKKAFLQHDDLIDGVMQDYLENGPREIDRDLISPETQHENLQHLLCQNLVQ
ncbi:unnamed protein product [Mytilus coruscus]|uniref:Uncharacterized protein n=1 Tax=Mytilus coruscus TaxID=42192 RepID=A0A6J8AVV7_MYTCO|nr:unnamed protein product [Mytilus coruscus]